MIKTIHIEGLDLAGKSTIARLLAQRQGFELHNNSLLPKGYNPFCEQADQLRKTGPIGDVNIGELYLKALEFDLEQYDSYIGDSNIIQDSTILIRSISYHTVYGNYELAKKFRALLPRHPRFCISCFLIASDEVRKMRLRGRVSRHNDNPEDYLIISDPQKFYDMEKIIKELIINDFNGIIIDSSKLEQDNEKTRIVNMILEKTKEQ